MLIRSTHDATFECLGQEHHALLSGRLASAWLPSRLDPLWVQMIGLHDNPWRSIDRDPPYCEETGLPHDFVTLPLEAKIPLYREGIDDLEMVHPWIAYMISLHYTTFGGTRDVDALNTPESERRERLTSMIAPDRLEQSETALEWLKFFDVLSLYLCLAGPDARDEAIPVWLRDPDDWSTSPDGAELTLCWQTDEVLELDPWTFAREALTFDLTFLRVLPRRANSAEDLEHLWETAPTGHRTLRLVPASGPS